LQNSFLFVVELTRRLVGQKIGKPNDGMQLIRDLIGSYESESTQAQNRAT